jgi:type I restriction enzyme S subunit
MSDVIDFKGGSQPPKETFEYEEKEGYIRLVQIRDFRTDKFKTYIPESLAKRRFEIDDVMIGRYGPPVFQILRGLSGSYNVALMKAAPKEGVTKDFVYRLLQLPAYQDAVISNSERTAGQTGVNLDLLNSLDVPLPPLDIQILMSERVGKVEELASKLKLDLHDAESLFSSLSQKAFRGEL